jgi:TPR repeat protein
MDQTKGTKRRRIEIDKRAADAGFVDAVIYFIHDQTPEIKNHEMLNYFKIAAEHATLQGNIVELVQLGQLLLKGTLGEQGLNIGVDSLKEAASLGSKEAMTRLSKHYFTMKPIDIPRGLKWLEMSADHGEPGSMIRLGKLWIEGKYRLPVDISKGEYWFERAVKAGSHDAALSFGTMLFNGNEHLPQDQSKGMKWICKAAVMGSINAKNKLDQLLIDDPKKDMWLRIAAEAGEPKAMYRLGIYLLENAVEKNKPEGWKWLKKAVSAGVVEARFYLEQEADIGTVEAAVLFGKMLLETGDVRQGESYLIQAGNRGSVEAMYTLAKRWIKKKDPTTKEQGIKWMKKAADSGLVDAAIYFIRKKQIRSQTLGN